MIVQVIDTRNDGTSNGDDFDGRSRRSTRTWLSTNLNVSKLAQGQGHGHAGVIAPWTGGTWLPEYDGRNCREPASSRWRRPCSCAGNNEAMMVPRNSTTTNKVSVILSAVDLPSYATSTAPPAFHCQCLTTLDVRCLPSNAWRCRGLATTTATHYLRVASPGERLRKYSAPDGRAWSRNNGRSVHYHDETEPTSSNPSPEPFTRRGSTPTGSDRPVMGCGMRSVGGGSVQCTSPGTGTSQGSSGSPAATERRVYTLARAYSDRVKNLHRRSASTCHYKADDGGGGTDCRVQVHRARAHSSTSAARRTGLPLSPALMFK